MTRSERRKYGLSISAAASAIGRAPDGVDDELDSLLSNASTALCLASERLHKLAERPDGRASNASAAQRPPDSSVAETPEEEH